MLKSALKIFWSLLTKLISEEFIKKVVLRCLRYLVNKTKNLNDDKILNDICIAWGMNKEEIEKACDYMQENRKNYTY